MTLNDAVVFCRDIEPTLKELGYHCGITGSCLYAGESAKDMDIIIYPHDVKIKKPAHLILDALGKHGVQKSYDEPASTDDKEVWVGKSGIGRVDFFFLS